MQKHCAANERIKRKYFAFLREAMRHSEPTVDAVAKAIHLFEEYTKYRDFKTFHYEQAVAFKRKLAETKAVRSGEKLSKSTVYATLQALKRFFQWLALQPGYKSSFQYPDAQYFNLSDKDTRIATTHREQAFPTIQQIEHVLHSMPRSSDIERRNQALIAFTLVTGARDSSIASAKLKHVDVVEECFEQDAREVKTKFSKTFVTYFFPVSREVLQIVIDWVDYLRTEKLWGNDNPLFPASKVALNADSQFAADGLSRAHWSSASPIRGIFRDAFQRAGLPYFNPHSFRNTLVRLGEERCKSPEEFKAWSQNLGHEKVLTTFTSYGAVARNRQSEILRKLAQPNGTAEDSPNVFAQEVANCLLRSGLVRPIQEA